MTEDVKKFTDPTHPDYDAVVDSVMRHNHPELFPPIWEQYRRGAWRNMDGERIYQNPNGTFGLVPVGYCHAPKIFKTLAEAIVFARDGENFNSEGK